MRADRLLSLLMLLQTRGRMTAQALAGELEVSVRTVYRDVEALSAAGVPIYADRGPGGGCALVDNYRTRLTGLHAGEVRALFMASMPAALAELGFGAELKAALLKLLAALPAERQHDEEWVRARVFLDWESWQPHAAAPRALQIVRQAVWSDRCIQITYRRESSFYRREFNRLVNPLGLVSKEGTWHLVCTAAGEPQARMRVFTVAELVDVRLDEQPCRRPEGFDLQDAWRAWCERMRQEQNLYVVVVRVAPELQADLALYLGDYLVDAANSLASTGDDWLAVVLHFESLEGARTKLLGLGAGIEVVTPIALRRSLLDFAQQVVKHYSRH